MSNSGKGALRYKYIEEESGFAGRLEQYHSDIPVPEHPQEPSKATAIPRGAGFSDQHCHIHQSLSILLIISIAETPLIGSGLNMQGTVQVKTKNICDLIGHRMKLNIDLQITNRKVLSAGQTISKETVPRHTSFPF